MEALSDDLEAFKKFYRDTYSDDSREQIAANAATNHRFVHEMQTGDAVALSNAKDQWIYLGQVEGAYFYASSVPKEVKEFVHQRKVKWKVACPRSAFSEAFHASLNVHLTLSSLDKHAAELQTKLKPYS
jgi:predicted Mrr-cat superfamily restriction endonuclease